MACNSLATVSAKVETSVAAAFETQAARDMLAVALRNALALSNATRVAHDENMLSLSVDALSVLVYASGDVYVSQTYGARDVLATLSEKAKAALLLVARAATQAKLASKVASATTVKSMTRVGANIVMEVKL